MKNSWLDMWDNRYSEEGYAYGTAPNAYLKEKLKPLSPGTILFPADGEGRNGVFAATQGWKVSAFDISTEGQKKALKLAEANHITIDYRVGELPTLNYQPEQFDAIALIFAHFPIAIRSKYHKLLSTYLCKGGFVIIEAFDKSHLEYRLKNPKVGGPGNSESLSSLEELKADFSNFEIIEAVEQEIELKEGNYHVGKGHVARFMARKI